MTTQYEPSDNADPAGAPELDVIVVGAGFGGLRMLHSLREAGLSARILESSADVGGNWLVNSYPGARTDTVAWVYTPFSRSKELQEEWRWTERYPAQPETLAYTKFAAERLNLYPYIDFNTRVVSATYGETSNTWTVTTDDDRSLSAKYLVMATGPLSRPYKPDIFGLDDFEGDWYLTGHWPKQGVDFAGKRVGVIGTGATGVQVIPTVAHTADHVTVFQRTANFVLPARNAGITDAEWSEIQSNYDDIWDLVFTHPTGAPFDYPVGTAAEIAPDQQQQMMERSWELGAQRISASIFSDVRTNEETSNIVGEFVRNKIRTIVEDAETAELLCPNDHPFGSKRVPLGHYYFETFNRKNVSLVDVSDEPITSATPRGLQTGGKEYACDIIIFATGFDAVTAALTEIDVRGRDNASLAARWADGPHTYLGVAVDGFPNMFMVGGPQTPYANFPPGIEIEVDHISSIVQHAEERRLKTMEATPEAVAGWQQTIFDLANATILSKGKNNWIFGRNIPGKPDVPLLHVGGLVAFRESVEQDAQNGFEGFSRVPEE